MARAKPKAGPPVARIDVSLGLRDRGTQLPTADVTARFKKAIREGTLSVSIENAFKTILRDVSKVPAGKACAIRDVADMKSVATSAGPETRGRFRQRSFQTRVVSDKGRFRQKCFQTNVFKTRVIKKTVG